MQYVVGTLFKHFWKFETLFSRIQNENWTILNNDREWNNVKSIEFFPDFAFFKVWSSFIPNCGSWRIATILDYRNIAILIIISRHNDMIYRIVSSAIIAINFHLGNLFLSNNKRYGSLISQDMIRKPPVDLACQ